MPFVLNFSNSTEFPIAYLKIVIQIRIFLSKLSVMTIPMNINRICVLQFSFFSSTCSVQFLQFSSFLCCIFLILMFQEAATFVQRSYQLQPAGLQEILSNQQRLAQISPLIPSFLHVIRVLNVYLLCAFGFGLGSFSAQTTWMKQMGNNEKTSTKCRWKNFLLYL